MHQRVDKFDPSSPFAGKLRREALVEGGGRTSREIVQDSGLSRLARRVEALYAS
jgi:hypothetical protein